MNRFAFAVLPLLALTACAAPAPKTSPLTRGVGAPITAAQAEVIQGGVRASMKDPASATFDGPMRASTNNGIITVCGYVNAKNSFGGYTGYQPYIGTLSNPQDDTFTVIFVGGGSISPEAITRTCTAAGVQI